MSPQYLKGAELESLVTLKPVEVARNKLWNHIGDRVTVRSAYPIAILILTSVTAVLRSACHRHQRVTLSLSGLDLLRL